MFSWIRDLKIGARVLIGMLVPALGLLFFAGASMIDKYETSQELHRVSELAQLAPRISGLVHELQKERGRSAGYIGSRGRNFADSLPPQRRETDIKRGEAQTAIDSFDFSAFDAALGDAAQNAVSRLGELEKMRGAVDSFGLSVPEMAKYYTGAIMSLLGIVDELQRASSDDRISKEIAGYISFLQGKERAGLERAMGAAGFGSGQFQQAIYNNFVRLIGAQDLYFTNLRLFSDGKATGFFDQTMTGAAVEDVARMREVALKSPQTGDLEGITAAMWFQTITAKINLMKQVEDQIAVNLEALAVGKEGAAWNAFLLNAGITMTLLLLTALMVFGIVRSITVPVAGLTDVMHRLANGDKSVEILGAGRGDEIGSMAKAVEVFKKNAVEMERMESEQAVRQARAEQEKKSTMNKMADDFENSVGQIVEVVSSAATEMQATAESMSRISEQTSSKVTTVSTASQQATANVQSVASATEELSTSVQEIGRQVGESTKIAGQAVEEATRVGQEMQELAENSQRIGEVINLINDIAEQTNLLALNATIEAARAGDAGKGFAVVASEVKNLASQTSNATGEIAEQIGSIQSATGSAVSAIEGIGGTIRRINEIAAIIASAVEEQSAATREISANVQEAARGTQQVDSNMGQVSEGATETGAAAGQVLASAKELAQQSGSVQSEVEKFLAQVRSA